MPTIPKLSPVDEIAAADLFPLYSSANGDARRASGTVMRTFMQSGIDPLPFTTQYESPSNDFTTTLEGTDNLFIIFTLSGLLATGTIVLPSPPTDKQEVLAHFTNTVTSLTVSSGGSETLSGQPTSILIGNWFKMRFDETLNKWYRVG